MMHRRLLRGLIIIYLTKGIFVGAFQHSEDLEIAEQPGKGGVQQFTKPTDRVVRSTPSCDHSNVNTSLQVTYGDDVTINCSCSATGGLKWFDSSCVEVETSGRIDVATNLKVKSFNRNDSLSYECKIFKDSNIICSYVTILSASEKTPTQYGGGGAVAAVLIILVVIALLSLCYMKKRKSKVTLFFRDTFKPNDGRDGKEFDAYVSTGFTEIDRRFTEVFISETLQKKCGYRIIHDNLNILPKLDYSTKLNSNIHRCRRLVVIFSPSYMTHDWCMYCFNEGLRKIVDLNVPKIFVITDHTMLSELRTHAELIAHIPQILLTQHQSSAERERAIERIRELMPAPMRSSSFSFRKKNGMRSPIMSDAESIHKSDFNLNEDGTAFEMEDGTEYTFGTPPQQIADEIQQEYDEALEEPGPDEYVTAVRTGEEIDPSRVQVNEYGARKDFYSLTTTGDV